MDWIRYILTVSILASILGFSSLSAQYRFQADKKQEIISLHEHAKLFNAEYVDLNIDEVVRFKDQYDFKPFEMENPSVGFCDHHLWVKIEVENPGQQSLKYYFETGRPIIDNVELYLLENGKVIQTLKNGDAIPFEERSFPHRKVIFPLEFSAQSQYEIYIHYKSDGEVVNLPLLLWTDTNLIQDSYITQLMYGGFYGLMVLAVITYLFFYFALKDKSFWYYCLYVTMAGALQFSLDGYFYQYLDPSGGWLGRHAVIISGFLLTYFFMRYTQVFLKLSVYLRSFNNIAIVLNVCLVSAFMVLLIFPSTFSCSYLIANLMGMVYLIYILVIIIAYYRKGYPIDPFFAIGIAILACSFVFFLLRNLSILPNSFLTENSVKLGTGLEIVFLSLSMGNRIRVLKSEKEKLQGVALKKSEEMNELKSYFLSNMSHELRTPLNAIMGMTEVMIKEIENPQLADKCEVIKNASLGLLSSVNNILDFSKIEKGELRLDMDPFDPVTVIEALAKNTKQNAQTKGLSFEFTNHIVSDYLLLGDSMRVGQIAHNILENAVKFTPQGSIKLELNANSIDQNHMELHFIISDTGVGISENKIEDIFDSLTQEDISHNRRFGGFGLGLFITKNLVDLHKGEINVTSERDVGSVFSVRLPFRIEEVKTQPILHFPQDTQDLKGTTILVVEDNLVNQMVMRAILNKWENTHVFVANQGVEALSILKKEKIDMILMDLQMPIMNGFEATVAIRRGDAGNDCMETPIIAITADVEESSRKYALSIGMNDYLTKPANSTYLYKKITEVLSAKLENKKLV